jgi:hypothetical protein
MSGFRFLVASTLGALVCLAAGSAAGADDPGARRGGPAATAGPAAQSGTARGVVKALGAGRITLDTSATGGSGPALLLLDGQTVVTRQGKTATVKDLQVGDPVTVAYQTRDGQAVARRVWIRAR